jgi:Dickkopf N-terminal cysteine-rich region
VIPQQISDSCRDSPLTHCAFACDLSGTASASGRDMRPLDLVMLLCALTAGCGSSETTSVANLRSTIYQRSCELLITCNLPLGGFFGLYGEGIDGCAQLLERASIGSINDLVTKVENGEVAFDGVAFDACYRNAFETCSTLATTEPCLEAFSGSIEVGNACNVDIDCAGDAYCDNDSGLTCPGTCAARKAIGAPCNRRNECTPVAGIVACSADPGSNQRVCSQRPTKVVAAGARCGANVDGVYSTCGKGLWCKTDVPFPFGDLGTCAQPVAEGSACSAFDVCARNTTCTDLDQSQPQQCTALTVSRKLGAPCGSGTKTLCSPLEALACIDGACAAIDGAAGASCDNDFIATCDPGLVCIAARCSPPVATEQPCSDDGDCASGSCDPASGRCRAAYCN